MCVVVSPDAHCRTRAVDTGRLRLHSRGNFRAQASVRADGPGIHSTYVRETGNKTDAKKKRLIPDGMVYVPCRLLVADGWALRPLATWPTSRCGL